MKVRIPVWVTTVATIIAAIVIAVIVVKAPDLTTGTSTTGRGSSAARPDNPDTQPPAPPGSDPTPGYPRPTPYKSAKVTGDSEKADGSRVVTFSDGGYITFRPMNGAAATGVNALITKAMLGQGSPARGSIKPPGYTSPWPEGPHARGHILARLLGGSGDDARNLFTIIQKPVNSPQMSGFEDKVRDTVERGENIRYTVTLQYVKAGQMPRQIAVTAKGEHGKFSESIQLENKAQ